MYIKHMHINLCIKFDHGERRIHQLNKLKSSSANICLHNFIFVILLLPTREENQIKQSSPSTMIVLK